MPGGLIIRAWTGADVACCHSIFSFYVASGGSNLDLNAPTLDEFRRSFHDARAVIIASDHGEVVGYAKLFAWSQKAGYSEAGETSVYVRPDSLHCGVGWELKQAIIAEAIRLGYRYLIARVIGSNTASRLMNEKAGYRLVGIQRSIGRTSDGFVDIALYEKILDD